MKQRIITALALIAVCLPCVVLGGIPFAILTLAFIVIGTHEVITTLKINYPLWIKGILYVLFVGGWVVATFASIRGMLAYFGFAVLLLFTLAVINEKISIGDIGLINLVLMDLCATIYAFERIDDMEARIPYLLLLLIGTYLTDSTALFCGKAFGKHKLNPRISPKKTIEGSVGAYIITTSVSFGLVYLFKLPMDTFTILCCALFAFVGQIGDLAFSAIKRYYDIKDFGKIFPGHGGVLDRVDSLTFNCILAFILMVLFK